MTDAEEANARSFPLDLRRLIMTSWKKGFDFGDHYCSAFRKVAAKIIRKREKRLVQQDLDTDSEPDEPYRGPFYKTFDDWDR